MSQLSRSTLPFVPAQAGTWGVNQAAVVPAKAGTQIHQGFGYRWLRHMALLRRMGPRLRGDDSGESLVRIFFRGDARIIRLA